MHRNQRSIFATAFALFLAGGEALAQGVTGAAVTGTVTRAAGSAPIGGANVLLRNTATGETFTATTSPTGAFTIDNVPAGGPYSLTVIAEGLQPAAQDDIQLTLGQRLALNIPLKKELVEEITVTAHRDANADRGRTGPSTVLKSTTITEMPLQGRNFTDLLNTDPRISGGSVAGQNNRFNNIQIDGGANNDLFGLASNGTPGGQANAKPLSLEAIQEFTINVAPFDVRQGMFAGGLVNAVTKSGTNEFHGDVFGYFQNKSLASQNAYINGQYITDPNFLDYHTIQYGATLGGPIIKDKVHFFVAADLQSRSSSFGNQFQMTGVDANDVSRVGFTNAQAQTFIDTLKTRRGFTGGDPGNVLAPSLGNPDRNLFVKVTSSAIENSHLEVSYNFVSANQDVLTRAPLTPENFNLGGLRDGYQLSNAGYGIGNTTNTARLKLTSNFADGRISNEFLTGFSLIRDARNIANDIPLVLVKLGDPTIPANSNPLVGPGVGSSPGWIAAGGERFSQANALDQNVFQLQDNVTFSTDQHRFTVGTSNEFFGFRNVFLQASTGAWAFNSLSDFENNLPAAFQRRFGVGVANPGTAHFSVAQWGGYLQDEYAPIENISITAGLRMDVPFLSHADQNTDVLNSPLNINTARTPSGNPLWSPRVGMNWDVFGTSDTVLRGGVGIFTGRPPYVWVSNAYTINGISQTELDCTRNAAGGGMPAFTLDPNAQPTSCTGSAAALAAQPRTEIDWFDPNTKYPQNLRLAAGADQRLPFGIVASADFLYTEDVNGWYTNDTNLQMQGYDSEGRALYGTLGTGGTTTNPTLTSAPSRIDNKVVGSSIEVYNKNGGKVYTGTLQLSKAIGRRYGVSVAYTYSRSYDRISLTSSQAFSNWRFAPVDGDLGNRNVRPSAFDRPHKLTVSGTAALPYGFLIGASYVGQSGLPYTWVVTGDVNGDGVNGNDLAFVPANASQISLRDPTQWAKLNDFINSQSCLRDARGGLVGRGACRNPWQDFMDVRLSWTSPNWKDQRIEVQYDIFNVLNLINSDWGHFDQVAPFETAPSNFLSAVGYDKANKRPIYSFRAPPTIVNPVYTPTLSRWRMQLGARYLF